MELVICEEEGLIEIVIKGYLEFKNVIFVYFGYVESLVICNVSFKVLFGEIVVFIGSIGSGKLILI